MCTKTHPAHPEYGTCVSNAENHAFCQFFGPRGEAEIWTNEDYVDIRQKPKAERAQDLKDMKVSVRDKRREDREARRRSVGKSSVTHLDQAERAEGAEKAHRAIETQFLEAALAAGREIMRGQRRMTADDLWDWLDAHEHYTEHPKAMRGILRRLEAAGVMAPVPDADPDSHRPSNRTNQSRLLRVYESQIFEAPTGLRNYG